MAIAADRASVETAAWPDARGRRVVFLLDAASPLERRVLEEWIAARRGGPPSTDLRAARPAASAGLAEARDRGGPGAAAEGREQCASVSAVDAREHRASAAAAEAREIDLVGIPCSRRPRGAALDPRLEAVLAAGDDPIMAPLRVAWLPKHSDGRPALAWSDILTLSDPRDPRRFRQQWTLRRHPERCCVVSGEPALLSDLRRRWGEAGGAATGETTGLAEFVARQATLALERAERRLRGARYKVPRLVDRDILGRPAFRGGLGRLARQLGKQETAVTAEAAGYLREIAATHTPFVIDIVAQAIRLLYTRGYGEALHYDHARLEEIYSLAQRYPVIFLPTHKSNLDHPVLQYALHEHGHPPNHTAGGINMNFFPVGPLVRRSGVFFIRRTFKDNLVYKFVLQHYIDYLIEKRFSLEWYLEGGRSRAGKLLPPRFGMLAYVVDAYRRGKSEDVILLPVSIAYDQIQDVGDYVAEQSGGAKDKEGFGWLVRIIRRLGHRYGDIHLRFGEPLSLREALGPPDREAEPNPDERNLALQKVAFDVCVRINRVTPITPTSLVTLALLGAGGRAMSLEEVQERLLPLGEYVRKRELPVTEPLPAGDGAAVRRVLEHLVENGVVTCFDEGPDAVYRIGSDQHLAAAYYRNTIIHFFVNGAIAELSLLAAAREGVADRAEAFWAEAMRLRDLLKFEFFFAEKKQFRRELERELTLHDITWEAALAGGPADVLALLRTIQPLNAHRVLRPFLEAYRVMGELLARSNADSPLEEPKLLAEGLALGKQYHLQRRITHAESVSKVLFATALSLARNRGLMGQATEARATAELREARVRFAEELRSAVRRVDAIEALAAERHAGLLD